MIAPRKGRRTLIATYATSLQLTALGGRLWADLVQRPSRARCLRWTSRPAVSPPADIRAHFQCAGTNPNLAPVTGAGLLGQAHSVARIPPAPLLATATAQTSRTLFEQRPEVNYAPHSHSNWRSPAFTCCSCSSDVFAGSNRHHYRDSHRCQWRSSSAGQGHNLQQRDRSDTQRRVEWRGNLLCPLASRRSI